MQPFHKWISFFQQQIVINNIFLHFIVFEQNMLCEQHRHFLIDIYNELKAMFKHEYFENIFCIFDVTFINRI
jgi:hypothetical protein